MAGHLYGGVQRGADYGQNVGAAGGAESGICDGFAAGGADFVYVLNRTRKIPDDVSVKAGFSMIFFLLLLILLVNGDYGITD